MEQDKMQPTAPSETSERLREAQRLWHETSFQRAVQQAAPHTTASDIPVVPLATPVDWPEDLYLSHLGFPGEAPYTRGVQPTMYRGRLWTTRIFSGFGTAQETNQRYKYLLAQGNGGLSVAFDLPALYGYDADHPMAAGEVGKCGVAVSSLADR
jgi:methylmalonyl-CoA mutase N-terminal domain/subunit